MLPTLYSFGILRGDCFIRECLKKMRLDKFLKVSRLVKRRTVANELCDGGHVQINGKVVKPAVEVVVGDTLRLRLGNRILTVQVQEVPQRPPPVQEASRLYQVLGDTMTESLL